MRRNDGHLRIEDRKETLPLPLPHPPSHDNRPEHDDEDRTREMGGAKRAEPEAVRAKAAHRGAAEGIENEVEAEE